MVIYAGLLPHKTFLDSDLTQYPVYTSLIQIFHYVALIYAINEKEIIVTLTLLKAIISNRTIRKIHHVVESAE